MTDSLSKLPLFATDIEIAIAIVGKARAFEWKRCNLPLLEAKGFPKFDHIHGGRPVSLIRHYYDCYLGLAKPIATAGPDGEEDMAAWTRSRSKRPKSQIGDP
jgi:hypothetical protein